jgi:multiple sugar transport system permease protein
VKRHSVAWWVAAAVYVVVTCGPLLWILRTSFAPEHATTVLPSTLSLEHYRAVLSRPELRRYLFNSALVSLTTVAIVVPVSLAAGYSLARYRFWGQRLAPVFLVAPLLPAIAILVAITWFMRRLGLYDSLAAVILANSVFALPLALWMLRNFVSGTPVEVEEAAQIDGCSLLGVLMRIVVPQAAPGVVAVAVCVFIGAWNNYLYAFALTSSQDLRVLPQAILAFLGAWGTYWGGLSAAGVIAVVPPILLFLIFQKWFVAGIFQQWSR